jgi:hypothetical protein
MFLSQGIGIVLEALFKQFTGRKVGVILILSRFENREKAMDY